MVRRTSARAGKGILMVEDGRKALPQVTVSSFSTRALAEPGSEGSGHRRPPQNLIPGNAGEGTSMVTALTDRLWASVHPIFKQILDHRFLQGLTEGSLPGRPVLRDPRRALPAGLRDSPCGVRGEGSRRGDDRDVL